MELKDERLERGGGEKDDDTPVKRALTKLKINGVCCHLSSRIKIRQRE